MPKQRRNTNLRGKRVLVLGLGMHGGGVGVAKWLVAQGAHVTVTDLRSKRLLAPSIAQLSKLPIAFVLGKHQKSDITAADLVVKNPAISQSSPYLLYAKKKGIAVTTDIALFYERCLSRIIGVTGTKGKSTTSAIITHLIKGRWPKTVLAGNARISPLKYLDSLKRSDPIVLELSSWQLQDAAFLKYSPSIAVLTNFYPDHLDRHSSLSEYLDAKKKIIAFQKSGNHAVVNYEDAVMRKIGNQVRSKVTWFSKKPVNASPLVFLEDGVISFKKGARTSRILPLNDIPLKGEHNAENILAAVAAAHIAGIPYKAMREKLQSLKTLPGRLEVIAKKKCVTWINDTSATNPHAAIAALNTIKDSVILIAGGSDKKLPLMNLVQKMSERDARVILLPGKASDKLAKLLTRIHMRYLRAKNMKSAVRIAHTMSQPRDTVLLSPGCASFGLFLHEFDRGEQFIREVRKLR